MSRWTEDSVPTERPKERREFPWTLAVIVPLAITGGVLGFSKWQQLQSLNNQAPVSQPVTNSVNALGRLEPRGEVIRISAPTSGITSSARVEQIMVQEGERVRKDQVIAVLDSFKTNQAAMEEAKAKLLESRANLGSVRASSPRDLQSQTAVIARLEAQMRGERDAQQAGINRLEAQLRGEQVAQQATVDRIAAELRGQTDSSTATVARSQAEQRNAQVDSNRYESLFRQGAISAQERDRRRLSAETSTAQLSENQAQRRRAISTLQQQLAEARANQSKTIATLQQQINEARANRNKTLLTLQRQIEEERSRFDKFRDVAPSNIQIAQAQVTNAIANMRKAEAQLNQSYIKAPISGEIIKIHTKPGETMGTSGIAEIGRTDEMLVVAEIPEDSIGRVRLGQKATIRSDNGAFSGQLQGTVSEIGRKVGKRDILNTDPAADVDARVVEVKIALSREESERVSGLTFAKVLVEIGI
ncbi:HlyD family efflux transporter periplasmic adaptor subunit [Calothrix sp. UHCC 0171]|uniref:HlyD family efflux transporter periplasmic adaptor subunit n=1 Tax=Calothrix sp. UHCC 0171 TaxID=3110245 RepID=UPI002B1FC67F|nr:HlyD family efflux transporter periplasmic adaptor subunit [Calothrix sp. UHCC 0171]MEA5570303.1 HlyD family efflux transporter periplasmic adaptor subunit [Calothrix sp. UHCC 0171]